MEKTIDYDLRRGDLPQLLRNMKVGDVLTFPLSKLDSVRNVAYNRLVMEKADGARWRVEADLENKITKVTRE